MMDTNIARIITDLGNQFPDKIIGSTSYMQSTTIDIQNQAVLPIISYLHQHPEYSFTMLVDLTAADYHSYPEPQPERFAIFYNLYSYSTKTRLIIRVFISESDPQAESIVSVFQSANWFEREIFDLFGIQFNGHPNLVRILTPEYFAHHPLRKDYPVQGLGERTQHERIFRTQPASPPKKKKVENQTEL